MAKQLDILIKDNNYILAKWGDEFVTWYVDENNNRYYGHYFANDLEEALKDYKERVKNN